MTLVATERPPPTRADPHAEAVAANTSDLTDNESSVVIEIITERASPVKQP